MAINQSLQQDGYRCEICGGPVSVYLTRMHDDRYGYPGSFDMHRCNACGHVRVRCTFSAAELSRLYTNYYPRANFDIKNHQTPRESRGLRSWLSGEKAAAFRWVPHGVRVLDIGCGMCETLAYHAARGCDVYGVEADENVRRIAEHFRYKVHVGLFDATKFQADFFDYVTLDQVIEHVDNPQRVMHGVAHVLKPGGTAIVSTPNPKGWGVRLFRRNWINWHVPYHLQQFTRQSLRIVAEDAGLRLISAKTLTHSDWLFFQLLHVLEMPAPAAKHPFWTGAAWKHRAHERAQRFASRLRAWHILDVVTRVIDAMGLGDNQLFFLRKPSAQS